MASTLEKRLYNAIAIKSKTSTIKKLIEQDVDCNLAHFHYGTHTFISPIQLAAKNDRRGVLCLLYKHRNRPTKIQLEKHLNFYINHHICSQDEDNEILFDYVISRLLYIRITKHPPKVLHTLRAAVHNYDGVIFRGQNLCEGSYPEIALQLRIYTLFRKMIDITTDDSKNATITIVLNELLHNLETYYFLYGISHIPVCITQQMISKKYTEIESSQQLLVKYYRCIAENVIIKIEKLQPNEEYTIPTGWIGHAICLSFQRISPTHVSIRVDNPTPYNPKNSKAIVESMGSYNIIKPYVLGRLHVNDLAQNLDYFVLLIDSVKRDLKPKEGVPLIYNLNKQIRHLDEKEKKDVDSFEEQANANCFFKCFEPGFQQRIGRTHKKLYHQILLAEQNYVNLLVKCCEDTHRQPCLNDLFFRFNSLAESDTSVNLPLTQSARLQKLLKDSYKQHYQKLLSNINREFSFDLRNKYVPLRFEMNYQSIQLKNFFDESRVLLLGDAGCGKSSLCQYATFLWAAGDLWNDPFEWLFYISMRNLNSQIYPPRPQPYSLINIIEAECFQGYKLCDLDKMRLTNQLTHSSKMLWIVDGYDERNCPDHLHTIERELLAKPHLLLASRPYETFNLPFDRRIHIQKFDHHDIKRYVDEYFPMFRKSAESCWLSIHSSHQLQQTARIPACLETICYLWDRYKGDDVFKSDMTMGEVYEKMCEYLLRRYLLKFHRQCTFALAGRDIYQQANSIAFTHLEFLAFKATRVQEFTITGEDIANVTRSSLHSVLQVGLLICKTRNPSSVLAENAYHFIHRTFQEYLCARHLIRELSSTSARDQANEVIKFITNEKYNCHLQNVFRLFFELKRPPLCTEQFWSIFDSEPRDLIGIRHWSRLIRWFPNDSCNFSPDDRNQVDKRTIDAVKAWIKKTDRLAHDYSNTYLFEWFVELISAEDWLTAWKEDLFLENASKRRYFLPQLWSNDDVSALQKIYDTIPSNVYALYRLIQRGPTKMILDTKSLALDSVQKQTEIAESVRKIKEKARIHQPITTLTKLQEVLECYALLSDSNRRSFTARKEPFPLNIAPSVLENIDNKTLQCLLTLIEQDTLFFRHIKLPIQPFLELYVKKLIGFDENILRSLIVQITLSSEYLLIAPPGEQCIRIYQEKNSTNIPMDEQRWHALINAFDEARRDYGYAAYFSSDT